MSIITSAQWAKSVPVSRRNIEKVVQIWNKLNFFAENVMCFAEDNTRWDTPHDVNLKLRCPKSGTGYEIAFSQVDVWMTSNDLDCRVTEGGVGYGSIGLQLTAYKTNTFRYIADVFSV